MENSEPRGYTGQDQSVSKTPGMQYPAPLPQSQSGDQCSVCRRATSGELRLPAAPPPMSFYPRMVYWEFLLGGEELRVPATRSWTPALCLLPRILAILAKQRKSWSQGRDRGDTETHPMHVTQRHSGTLQPHHSRSETLSQPPGQRVSTGSLGTCRPKKRNTQASRPSLSPWPRSQESGCLVRGEEPDWG